jgi:hypothetical protein
VCAPSLTSSDALLKENCESLAPAATPSIRTTVHARAKDVNDLDSANLPLIGDTLTQCDPFDIPSTRAG